MSIRAGPPLLATIPQTLTRLSPLAASGACSELELVLTLPCPPCFWSALSLILHLDAALLCLKRSNDLEIRRLRSYACLEQRIELPATKALLVQPESQTSRPAWLLVQSFGHPGTP